MRKEIECLFLQKSQFLLSTRTHTFIVRFIKRFKLLTYFSFQFGGTYRKRFALKSQEFPIWTAAMHKSVAL